MRCKKTILSDIYVYHLLCSHVFLYINICMYAHWHICICKCLYLHILEFQFYPHSKSVVRMLTILVLGESAKK